MNKNGSTLYLLFAAISAVIFLAACDSGSLGSDVGDKTNQSPISKPFVQNGGETGQFREGAEVILASKSEDPDGPVLEFDWRQSAGPAPVDGLIERTQSVVSFTAPQVDAPTTVTFDLTVFDADNESDTASVSITVVPARDADQMLSFDFLDPSNPFDTFTVVAALAGGTDLAGGDPGCAPGAIPDPTDAIFDLTVNFSLHYPDRNGTEVEEPLSSPGTITGFWPACTIADPDVDEVSAPWNPRFAFDIPRLDINDFNQRFVGGDRSRILDPEAVDYADIRVSVALSAGSNQSQANLCLLVAGDASVLIGGDECQSNDGTGLPTEFGISVQDVLNTISDRESALTAEVYYRAVDPDDKRLTLNQWLQFAGFADDADGALRQEAISGDNTTNGQFAHAIYLNNFDLGFGRDMYTRIDDTTGSVYSFVTNYASLEGAVRNVGEFVIVVMEYSPPDNDPDGEKFVKFFTYVPDDSGDSPRVLSMNFDGRGERYTPGNCIACHGGGPPVGFAGLIANLNPPGGANCSTGSTDSRCYLYPNGGDLSSAFMPWDLESFLYTDTDPAITNAPAAIDGTTALDDLDPNGVYTRAAQESQFKKFNEAALSTYDPTVGCDDDGCRFDSVIEHIYGWYGGPTLPSSAFADSFVPSGWRNDNPDNAGAGDSPNDPETLYLEVYAQYCRACHNQLENKEEQFSSYLDFVEDTNLVETVYQRGAMPLARLSMDRFWSEFESGSGTAASKLMAHLESRGVDPALLSTPGTPRPDISGAPDSANRNQAIFLGGSSSLFADTYAWALQHTPPSDPPPPGGWPTSAARLAGSSGSSVSFATDQPGTYVVTLALNGADPEACLPDDGLCVSNTITVENFRPLAKADSGATIELSPREIFVLENDVFLGPDNAEVLLSEGDILSQDGPPVQIIEIGTPLLAGATAVLSTSGDSIIYTSPANPDPGQPFADEFTYSITDIDGEKSPAATVSIQITAILTAGPGQIPGAGDPVLSNPPIPVHSPNIGSGTVNISSLISGGTEPYTVEITSGPGNGTANVDLNGDVWSIDYTPNNDSSFDPDSFEYTVTDSSEPQQSADPAVISVTITPRAPYQVATTDGQLAVETTDLLWDNCSGCHGGDTPRGGFSLDGTALENYNCIVGNACANGIVNDRTIVSLTDGDPNNDTSPLILCKPTNTCGSHARTPRFAIDSIQYRTLERWIAEGANFN